MGSGVRIIRTTRTEEKINRSTDQQISRPTVTKRGIDNSASSSANRNISNIREGLLKNPSTIECPDHQPMPLYKKLNASPQAWLATTMLRPISGTLHDRCNSPELAWAIGDALSEPMTISIVNLFFCVRDGWPSPVFRLGRSAQNVGPDKHGEGHSSSGFGHILHFLSILPHSSYFRSEIMISLSSISLEFWSALPSQMAEQRFVSAKPSHPNSRAPLKSNANRGSNRR
jgi:hypothetical protein